LVSVLFVIFHPIQAWLARRVGLRESAAIVVMIARFVIVVRGVCVAGLVVTQAGDRERRGAESDSRRPRAARNT
jgi:predicted PurR-regulated permease PerM